MLAQGNAGDWPISQLICQELPLPGIAPVCSGPHQRPPAMIEPNVEQPPHED